jgi:DNA-directed RNA polymerase specialized sigma24 family protein
MLDRRKKKKLKLEEIGPDALKVAVEGFANPESSLQCKEIWALMARVLQSMPPARQLAYRLCRLEGMEPEEAAVITGTKPETVRRQVYDAILQMRQAAEGLDILPEPTPARAIAKPKKQKRVVTLPNPFKALGARLRRTEES